MTEIGPGTPLVCINDSPPFGEGIIWTTWDSLTLNAIYFCEEVYTSSSKFCPWDGCGRTGIILKNKGMKDNRVIEMYCPNLFRPLNDGDVSLVKDVTFEECSDALRTGTPIRIKVKETENV